jgi:hypothetical protein
MYRIYVATGTSSMFRHHQDDDTYDDQMFYKKNQWRARVTRGSRNPKHSKRKALHCAKISGGHQAKRYMISERISELASPPVVSDRKHYSETYDIVSDGYRLCVRFLQVRTSTGVVPQPQTRCINYQYLSLDTIHKVPIANGYYFACTVRTSVQVLLLFYMCDDLP